MIRVAIVADTGSRARDLAETLSEEDGIEVISVNVISADVISVDVIGADVMSADYWRASAGWESADVLLVAALKNDDLPAHDVPMIVLSASLSEDMPLRSAIRGWLSLNASPEQIAGALVAAANGLTVVTAYQATRWLRSPVSQLDEDGGVREALTPRELQVLRMLADGFENKEIAAQLKISEHTAKFHVAQILAKFRASGRAEAVAIGMRRGLVPV